MSRIKTLFRSTSYRFSSECLLSAAKPANDLCRLVSVTPQTSILSAVDGGYFKSTASTSTSGDVRSSTALAAMLSGEMSFITIAGSGVINAHRAGRDA